MIVGKPQKASKKASKANSPKRTPVRNAQDAGEVGKATETGKSKKVRKRDEQSPPQHKQGKRSRIGK